jgi:hypothetical protein
LRDELIIIITGNFQVARLTVRCCMVKMQSVAMVVIAMSVVAGMKPEILEPW